MNGKNPHLKKSKSPNDAKRRAPSDLDVLTFGHFDVCSSPDFTRRVMGRLGYMRVSAKAARRDRVRRWSNRVGILLVMAIAICIADRYYHSSDQVRRPASLTIPAAISNDVRQQQDNFQNMIRSIRSVVPVQPRLAPMITPRPDDAGEQAQPLEGDFDQPQNSPFRWV